MAVDPSARQSDWISTYRADLTTVMDVLSTLGHDRLKVAALGGVDSFGSAAFAGANADLSAADIDASLAALTSLNDLLYDSSGNPTPALIAIVKVAR